MSSDLDALPFNDGTERPALSTATVRRHRHRWVHADRWFDTEDGERTYEHVWACEGCGRLKDEARSRRGRNNRKRGNRHEREWAKRLGLRRVGQYGETADGRNEMFAGQSKSLATGAFPGWMTNELTKLRAAHPELVPLLGVLEATGGHGQGRRLVVMEEADWVALHVGRTP
jgi:hypothetical protein